MVESENTDLESGSQTQEFTGDRLTRIDSQLVDTRESVGARATEVLEDPRLASFHAQFDALSASDRKNMSWEQVLNGMTLSVPELLAKLAILESPQIFEVDESNNLVFCDGADEVPSFTLNKNYFDCRAETKAQGLEFFTEAEYERLQAQSARKYEIRTATWIECGDNPDYPNRANWDKPSGRVNIYSEVPPRAAAPYRGARRLMRVELNQTAH